MGLRAAPDTSRWWLDLALWMLALATMTFLVTCLLGRYEQPPVAPDPVVPASVAVAEALTTAATVTVLARYGLVPDGHVLWYVPFAASLLLIGVARTSSRHLRAGR